MRETNLERIKRFREFTTGWDSYSGKPISLKACERAKQVIGDMEINFGKDNVFVAPLSEGGIQIEIYIEP